MFVQSLTLWLWAHTKDVEADSSLIINLKQGDVQDYHSQHISNECECDGRVGDILFKVWTFNLQIQKCGFVEENKLVFKTL